MPSQTWRLQFGMRVLMLFVAMAAVVSWLLRPPPTANEVLARLHRAKRPREIRSILRDFRHLSGEEIRWDVLMGMEQWIDQNKFDYESDAYFEQSSLQTLFAGSKQWAHDDPQEVIAWIDQELHGKDVSDLGSSEWALMAILRGFTEGMAPQDLDKAMDIPAGFFCTTKGTTPSTVVCIPNWKNERQRS